VQDTATGATGSTVGDEEGAEDTVEPRTDLSDTKDCWVGESACDSPTGYAVIIGRRAVLVSVVVAIDP